MIDVVICEPLRTPVGGYLGSLAGLSASDLATVVVGEIAARAHLGEGEVDDVVAGETAGAAQSARRGTPEHCLTGPFRGC